MQAVSILSYMILLKTWMLKLEIILKEKAERFEFIYEEMSEATAWTCGVAVNETQILCPEVLV